MLQHSQSVRQKGGGVGGGGAVVASVRSVDEAGAAPWRRSDRVRVLPCGGGSGRGAPQRCAAAGGQQSAGERRCGGRPSPEPRAPVGASPAPVMAAEAAALPRRKGAWRARSSPGPADGSCRPWRGP